MNRKNMRVFASEELGVKTSGLDCKNKDELLRASKRLDFHVYKGCMSSSGHWAECSV